MTDMGDGVCEIIGNPRPSAEGKASESGSGVNAGRIPRVIHMIWIGDNKQRPDDCILSWQRLNPDWQIRLWTNKDYNEGGWRLKRHMDALALRDYFSAAADIMRWEILHRHGGFAVDADSTCIAPLPDWLFSTSAFACWENERYRTGLLSTCALGFVPSHPLITDMIESLDSMESLPPLEEKPILLPAFYANGNEPWNLVGSGLLTRRFRAGGGHDLTIYPSHFFIPKHVPCGYVYRGSGHIFAYQHFHSTLDKGRDQFRDHVGYVGGLGVSARTGVSGSAIPRVIHMIWIGDESKQPRGCMESWRDKNPDWEFRLWGNEDYRTRQWRFKHHMDEMVHRHEISGAADIMRWEILYDEGGFAVDADSECVRSLEDWLFACSAFVGFEQEVKRPYLLSPVAMAFPRGHALIGDIMDYFSAQESLPQKSGVQSLPNGLSYTTKNLAWDVTGPGCLVRAFYLSADTDLTIYPSHYFCPNHLGTRTHYSGDGIIFARQNWFSTQGAYDRVKKQYEARKKQV